MVKEIFSLQKRKVYEVVVPLEAKILMKKGLCGVPGCGKKKRKGALKTCSPKCNKFFWEHVGKINDWGCCKNKALRRDKYTCQHCYKEDSLDCEVDHIIPVSLGGREFDLDNLQTLCFNCHKEKTKKDIKLIACVRRKLKILKKNQSLHKFFDR